MELSGCIKRDNLKLFVAGQTNAVDREEIEYHLSNCRACRQRLIAEYRESKTESISVPAPGWLKSRVLVIPKSTRVRLPPFGTGWRQVAATAAVIIVALLIGVVFMRDSFRSGELPKNDAVRQDQGISTAPRLLNPSGGEQLSSKEIEFRCSEVQGAEGYVFTVLNDKGDIVFRASTKEARLKLNSADVRLEPGKTYFWYAGAKLPAGTVAESDVGKFVLK